MAALCAILQFLVTVLMHSICVWHFLSLLFSKAFSHDKRGHVCMLFCPPLRAETLVNEPFPQLSYQNPDSTTSPTLQRLLPWKQSSASSSRNTRPSERMKLSLCIEDRAIVLKYVTISLCLSVSLAIYLYYHIRLKSEWWNDIPCAIWEVFSYIWHVRVMFRGEN